MNKFGIKSVSPAEALSRAAFPFEVKFAEGDAEGTFEGYGAVFGNEDSYGDVIVKGAFKDTLKRAKDSNIWPAMLLQHGVGWSTADLMPIGVWTEMDEDDKGLRVKGQIALETQRGRECYALLKMKPRPALSGLSIGYIADVVDNGTKPKEPRRKLLKIELFEVSPVTFPANPKSRVDGVKAAAHIKTIREYEDFLRDVGGFSHAAAKAIAAGGFKAHPDPRDEDGTGDSGLTEVINRAARTLRS